MTEPGVLPDSAILELISSQKILLANKLGDRQLQPASLDLTLGKKAWRVRASFLPSLNHDVSSRLDDDLLMHEIDLTKGAVLERGCVYLAEVNESLALPKDISAAANPKSSTGRIDVFVRMIVNRGTVFDEAPAGYEGPLFVEICPRSFSIIAREGSSLNQLRLKRGAPQIDDRELKDLHAADALLSSAANIENGLGVRIDLQNRDNTPIGWRARHHSGLIDVDKRAALAPMDFFEPVYPTKSHSIILDPDEFYILASKERLMVPPDYAAEMTPINTGLGEFRVHYAGFFDPGFGWSGPGSTPNSRGVLEVRSHDAPFVLDDGQLVARLVYERMQKRPDKLYGQDVSSNYQGQALKLSKHFQA